MRGKPIQAGDIVLFRLYNGAEHKFYGNIRRGTVTKIEGTLTRGVQIYWVETPREYAPYHMCDMWLYRKEIKKVIK